MKLDNLIFILVFLLFCGVTYIGIQDYQEDQQEEVNDRIQMNQEQLDMENLRKQAIEDAYFEALKYKDNVTHDSDPETKTYPMKLEAIDVFDAENDSIGYLWTQLEGEIVDLSSTSEKITYFLAKAGNYKFQLTVTDIYGAKSDTTKIIEIKDEPNTAPVATFSISNEVKPIFFPNGPTWQNVADSVKAFQTKYKLTVDGMWGRQSNNRYLKIKKDKKAAIAKAAEAKENKAQAKEEEAKKERDKKAREKREREKAKEMRAYTVKLNEIDIKITRRKEGGFFGKAADVKKLEAEREAHMKTKPK